MKTKKRNFILFVVALLGIATLMETKDILGVLGIQRAVAQTYAEKTGSLVNPTNSSVVFWADANQAVTLYLKNNNILGVTVNVEGEVANDGTSTWGQVIFPSSEASKAYSKYATLPVSYTWDISTKSSAANITIRARWIAF